MKKLFLLLTGTVLLFSCSKSSSDESNTDIPTVDSYAYFKGTINGAPFNYNVTDQNSATSPCFLQYMDGSSSGPAQFSYFHYLSSEILEAPANGNTKTIGITLKNIVLNSSFTEISNTEFDEAFSGSLPTVFNVTNSSSFYINVVYRPNGINGGTIYQTKDGDQSGSSITYSSSVAGMDGNYKTRTIKGTVSCKLYNSQNPSDVITLNNCQFKLIFKQP